MMKTEAFLKLEENFRKAYTYIKQNCGYSMSVISPDFIQILFMGSLKIKKPKEDVSCQLVIWVAQGIARYISLLEAQKLSVWGLNSTVINL